MGYFPRERRKINLKNIRVPRELTDFQSPSALRTVQLNVWKIKQKLQETCMDEQGAPEEIKI